MAKSPGNRTQTGHKTRRENAAQAGSLSGMLVPCFLGTLACPVSVLAWPWLLRNHGLDLAATRQPRFWQSCSGRDVARLVLPPSGAVKHQHFKCCVQDTSASPCADMARLLVEGCGLQENPWRAVRCLLEVKCRHGTVGTCPMYGTVAPRRLVRS